MNNLSMALRNLDPSIKSDIRKINSIIEETCNELSGMVEEPSTYTYYANDGFKITCNFINKLSSDILAALDDPSVLQPYVDKIKGPLNSALNHVEAFKIISKI